MTKRQARRRSDSSLLSPAIQTAPQRQAWVGGRFHQFHLATGPIRGPPVDHRRERAARLCKQVGSGLFRGSAQAEQAGSQCLSGKCAVAEEWGRLNLKPVKQDVCRPRWRATIRMLSMCPMASEPF